MQHQKFLMDEAVKQVLDAYDKDQFEAIPYIVAGWSTALLGDCMMSRVLGFDNEPMMSPGDVTMYSPTRVGIATEIGEVPTLQMVMRPAISLRKRPDEDKIIGMLSALQVGVDRLFYSAVHAKATIMQFGGYCEASERFDEEDGGTANRFAFVGANVNREFAHNHSMEGAVENPFTAEQAVMQPDQMILARFTTLMPLGVYCISPVRIALPRAVAKLGWNAIALVYGDTNERIIKHNPEYTDRLEFSAVIDVQAAIMQPDRFVIINNCATENSSVEDKTTQAGYIEGSSTTH